MAGRGQSLRGVLLSSTGVGGWRTGVGVASLALAVVPQLARGQVLPTGGQVVAGAAQINAAQQAMVINQSTPSVALNWQSFNIGAGASVEFIQPSVNAVALNRVVGADPSAIYGSLKANGQVFLLNPNGVLFGKGAQVNVGSLVASTGQMSDADFAQGQYRITGAGAGVLVNQAALHVKDGSIVLAAGKVTNTGEITADGGKVSLAAGDAFTLSLDNAGLMNVKVDQAAVDAQVLNQGLIGAEGGQVLLTARGRSMLLDSVVQNDGVVRATGLSVVGGQVVLDGGDGKVANSGQIDVSNAAGKGGEAKIIGETIALGGTSRIDASGRDGGGDILVGGDAYGKGETPRARTTSVEAGAELRANAITAGDGGKVVIWSDGDTVVDAKIYARGGAESGNGGFIETSGKVNLGIGDGMVADSISPNGRAGDWLLDPNNITVSNTGTATLANVSNTGDTTTNYVINASVINAAASNVVLAADNLITVSTAINMTNNGVGITFQGAPSGSPANPIALNQNITTTNGFVTLNGNVALSANRTISTGSGAITITGDITNTSSRTLALTSSGAISLGGTVGAGTALTSLTTGTGTVTVTGGSIRTSGAQTYGGALVVNTNALTLTTTGNSTVSVAGTTTLNADLTVTNGTGTATFSGAVDGAHDLARGSNGATVFSSTVGATTPLATLTTGAAATTLNGNVSTTGAISFGQNLTIGAATTINSTTLGVTGTTTLNSDLTVASTGTATFTGVVNGANDFARTGSGATTFSAAVGSTTPLASFATGSGTTTLTGNLSTSNGAVTMGGGLALAANAIISSGTGAISVGGNITNTASRTLALTSTGGVTLGGTVGGGTALTSLTTGASLATLSGDVSTTNNQTYGGALTTTGGVTLAASSTGVISVAGATTLGGNLAVSTGNGAVTFSGTINSSNPTPRDLTVNSGTALQTYSGVVGGTNALGLLTLTSSNGGGINLSNAANNIGSVNITANGAVTVRDANTLTVTGINAGGGVIDISTQAGNLTVTGAVTTTNTTSTAITMAAGRATNRVATAGDTDTGGNIIISGGSFSTGAGGSTRLFTGSIANSTGVATAAGVGNSRYWSDTNGNTGYTTALPTGVSAIFRERPIVTIAATAAGTGRTYDGTTTTPTYVVGARVNSDAAGTAGGTIMIGGAGSSLQNAGAYTLDVTSPTNTTLSNLGYSVQAGSQANYSIVPRAITAITGITASNRVYDATTAATLNTGSAVFTNMVGGDTLTVATSSGAFADKNVGSGKTVSITGLSLGGASASNYTLASTTASTTANITAATISAITGITANNRVYDATTAATLNTGGAAFTGKLGSDVLTVGAGTGAFADKNVGTAKTVSITGLTLGGADAGNYTLSSTTSSTTANITAATISAITGITANNRVYDTTTNATLNTGGAAFTGKLGPDVLTVGAGTGAFANKNVGTAKTVSITGLTLSGADAGNYTLSSTTASTTANITAATISAITGITANNRVYDATTAATLNTGGAAFTGKLGSDVLTVGAGTGAFADKNVGTAKTVSITGLTLGGADAGNYTLSSTTSSTTANITAATISAITGITANNRVYDTTTNATLNTGGAAFTGKLGPDVLTVGAGTGAFANKNVGTAKTVSITGLTLSGADAGNYTLTSNTASTTADITQASISAITGITASNRVYDTTTNATLNTGGAAFTGKFGSDVLTVGGGAGAFADKNVGTAKTVSITGLTLGGADAGNYTLSSTTASTTADITAATISAITGITASNRVYDATTNATLNTGSSAFTGKLGSDVLTVGAGSGTFADKNVGAAKTVSITGLTLGGADAGNYTLSSTTASTTADITAATISAITGITASNRVYDTTTSATLNTGSAAFTGKLGSDVLTVGGGTGAFADRNVGTAKTVSITGLTLGGADAGNYTLSSTTASTTVDITAATISAITGITANNRVYDTTTNATLNTGSAAFTGKLGSDVLSVGAGTGTFADKNVGSAKTVSITGLTLGGADAGNYTLSSTTASTTADITAATISAITGITANNRVYDTTTIATLSLGAASFTGKLGPDVLTVATSTGAFADKNVGTGKTVSITGLTLGGADAGNYTLSSTTASTTADITAATISAITGITASNRVYDATTDATLNTGSAAFTGKLGSDVLTVGAGTGAFADKNVGTTKTVSITGLTLSGADAGNYTLTSNTASTTADITQASISAITGITASNRVYDTTTNATLNTGGAAFTGKLGSDVLTVGAGTGAFADKNVGTAKTVSITGLTLSGTDAGNYTLTSNTASTTADITAATISAITGITASNKVYDATTSATLNSGSAAFTGKLGSDVLTVGAGTGAFADKNVGAAKTVSITGLTLSGADAGNYTLSATTASTTADITAATISAITGITASNRVYDTTTNATLNTGSAAFTGKLGSDVLTVGSSSGAFADKNVGTGKTVSITGLTLGGADAGNYTLGSSTASTTAGITAASITGVSGITADSRVYDATTNATLNTGGATFTGKLGADVLTITGGTGAFADKNVGTAKTVSITGLTFGGADAGNYSFGSNTATATADITAATISAITGITASNKVYDATTAATLNTGSAAFTGKLGSDVLTVGAGTGAFADKNVGTAKTVSITGLTLSGSDAGNYTLSSTTASTTADITAAPLTATAAVANNRAYDGTTVATLSNNGTLNGLVGGETLTLNVTAAAFADKNAGAGKTVTITGYSLADGTGLASNYQLNTAGSTTTADITQAVISAITGITAANKTYDATTTATLNTAGAAFTGKIGADVLTVGGGAGAFADKNVGAGKTVNITGLTLGGADAANYTLGTPTATATADITPASLTVTGAAAANKVYDATTAATLSNPGTLNGLQGGETLTLNITSAAFADKNAGVGKTVTITGYSLADGTGLASNYQLNTSGATATADITKATISGVTGVTAANKVYDATTAATLNTSGVSFTGVLGGDVLTVTGGTGAFSDKNVGGGKTVSVTGLVLGGADAGNYIFTGGAATATADITQATISGVTGVTAVDKVYDATTAATLNTSGVSFTGLLGGDVLTVTGGTGVFADKNVGTGKTVSITGLTLGGADAANYAFTGGAATATANITPAALTVTGVTAANKVYDATTTATLVNPGTLNGLVGGETLTLNTGSVVFADKNAGVGKTVTITGYSLANGAGLASNYVLNTAGSTTTADITPATISAITGIAAVNKVYDATTAVTVSTGSATFVGKLGSDVLTVGGGSGVFADKNVGVGKSITVTGLTLGGADAGNYTLASTTGSATGDITAAPLTLSGLSVADKVYDATTTATVLNAGTLSGLVGGETLTVNAGTVAFADKNAGVGKTVTVTGYSISDGSGQASNYQLNTSSLSTTATISQAAITGVTGLAASNKVYDATTLAALNTSGVSFTGVLGGDVLTVTGGTGAFADKNVGVGKTITVSGLTFGGADAGNYTYTGGAPTLTADITPASITNVTGIAADKVYDGTTAATINTSGATFVGKQGSDVLTITAGTGVFADKNVGVGKTVTLTGVTFGGVDAGNYTFAPAASTTTANITAAPLTLSGITANNKVYDATTQATLNTGSATLSGVLGGDTVTLAGATGAFVDKNVATGKLVSVSGLTLGGADAGNYALGSGSATAVADITPATISAVNGIGVVTKTYDGTTAATLTTAGATFVGKQGSDVLTLGSATGVFADKTAGTGKTVTITGITLGGADAGNYLFSGSATSTAIGAIDRAQITITGVTAANKVYDGTTAASLNTGNASFSGIIGGDVVTVSGLTGGAFADKNVGVGKAVVFSGLTLGGADAANYTVANNSVSTTADITRATITGVSGLSVASKTYDGTTAATLNSAGVTFTGRLGSDQLTVGAANANFSDKNVGTGKAVVVTGITLAGADAGNYTFTGTASATLSGDINAAILSLNGLTVANKTYDATTAATVSNFGTLSGLVSGETLGFSVQSAAFADKNVGAGKTVTVNYTLADGTGLASNYRLASNSATTTATITPATISAITGITAANKIFDGTTAATLTITGAGFTGRLSTDVLTVGAASGAFATPEAGFGKTVNITGLALGGADAGNYILASTTATTTASITSPVPANVINTISPSTTQVSTSAKITLSSAPPPLTPQTLAVGSLAPSLDVRGAAPVNLPGAIQQSPVILETRSVRSRTQKDGRIDQAGVGEATDTASSSDDDNGQPSAP